MGRKVLVTPLLHPAAVMRDRYNMEAPQGAYLKRLAACNMQPELLDVTQPPPGCNLYPSLNDLAQCVKDCQRLGAVSLDIEAAGVHVICVGLWPLRLEPFELGRGIVLRFRRRGGHRYWTRWSEHLSAVAQLGELLEDPEVAKVFHNGITFDVPELEALGFTVEGRLVDTMSLAHCAYPEQPKGLQFCATLYLAMSVWKTLVDEDDEAVEGKG